MEGWIKLHRQVIENGWLKNHSLWILWSYILLKATHATHKQKITLKRNSGTLTEDVLLKPGQLIFGRKKAAEDTGLSEQNIRTALKHLKCLKNITLKPTNNYSIISIVNWGYYQGESKNQPALNQHLTTNKNDKNDIIELTKMLIKKISKEPSLYSIIGKYKNTMGEERLKAILTDCIKRGNEFRTENQLAAYLETCTKTNGKSHHSFNPIEVKQ